MNIRNDITGLRGFAMILIYYYHYNKKYLPGGLIGVDIFFTICGYFITKSITDSLSYNKFSYMNFYSNRVKKLLPACYSLWIFLLIIYGKKIEKELVYDIIYSVLSIVNYRFYNKSVDYLSIEEAPSLILHFWTLSLQQQFYIIWPFVVVILYRYIKGIVISVTFISLSLCCYYNTFDVSYSYFSIFTRFWEIGFGSLLYIINFKNIYTGSIVNYISIFLLLFFAIYYNSEIYSYPNIFTVIPVIFCCVILINKDHKKNIILNNYFLIFCGTISYSFYIIHYPFLQIYMNNNAASVTVVIIINSLISSRIIEKKYNQLKYPSLLLLIITASLNLLFIFYLLIFSKKYIKSSKFNFEEVSGYNRFMKMQKSFILCPLIKESDHFAKTHKFILLGDCHVQQWTPIINRIAFENGYIVFHVYYWSYYIEKGNFDEVFNILNSIGYKDVIFLSQFLSYKPFMINYTKFSFNFKIYLKKLINHNYTKEIYVIQNTGYNDKSAKQCLKSMNSNCYGVIGINYTINLIPSIEKIKIINLNSYICNKRKCPFKSKNSIVFVDRHHLNPSFVKHLYPTFYKKLNIKYSYYPKTLALEKDNFYKIPSCCNIRWKKRKCMPDGD